jgi:hypothetical protein
MSLDLHTEITRLLHLAQTYAVTDEDELLFMKNTIKVFTEVLSLPLHTNDQNTVNQLREAYHTIENIKSELEDANASVND